MAKKLSIYDRGKAYAAKECPEQIAKINQYADGTVDGLLVQKEYLEHYLYMAYRRGYERAKREARNGK